jgi:hypothetical protein
MGELISASLYDTIDDKEYLALPRTQQSTSDVEHLIQVLRRVQLHCSTHYATCFKSATARRKRVCRLRYPRPIHPCTAWDAVNKRIVLKRANAFSTPHNPILSQCVPSNNDIQPLLNEAERARFKCIYITDYNTKPALALYDAHLVATKILQKFKYAYPCIRIHILRYIYIHIHIHIHIHMYNTYIHVHVYNH